MASPLRSLPSTARFLQLPAAIRSSIYAGALPQRHFSSSAPRKSSFVDIAIAGPTALLDAIHALGVPWYAAIPAAAILVRSTIGYRLGLLPTRKRHVVRSHLIPLTTNTVKLKTTASLRKSELHDKAIGFRPPPFVLKLRALRFGLWHNLLENHRTGKKFKAPLFTPAMGLNLGLLIVFAEAIRLKCGHTKGLLSMLAQPADYIRAFFTNEASMKSSAPVVSPEELIAERMERAQAAADAQAELYASGTGNVVVDPKLLDPAYHFELMGKAVDTYSDRLDPSMLVEGVSWAQNLAVPDSTFILPAMLSATMLISVFTGDHRSHTVVQPKDRKLQTRTNTSGKSSSGLGPARAAEEDLSLQDKEINDAFAAADKMRKDLEAKRNTGVVLTKWTVGQKLRLWVAGLFFVVSSAMPSGLLLYMIPSIVVGQLQTRWLDIKHPMPTPILPCKRPLRVKVRKTFAGT